MSEFHVRAVMPLFAATALFSFSTPSYAQEETAESAGADAYSGTAYDGDYMTVAAGGAYGPSYEGSDNYVVFPVAAAQGELSGIGFQMRGPALYFDIAPDTDGAKVDLIAGPTVRVNLNRIKDDVIKDDRVEALGELDTGIEVGGQFGFTVNRMFNPYDSMTLTMEARWDVNGASDGRILSPRITYFTPLSQAMAASLSVSAEHMDDDYADYYFGVSGSGAAASGLPAFTAREGWKSVGSNLFVAYDLNGNLEDGGLSLFANGSYKRLTNDAKDSPITSVAGDADQWMGAIGVGYTF